MRRSAVVSVAAAVVLVSSSVIAAPASAGAPSADQPMGPEEFLFTVQAARGTTSPMEVTGPVDESFRLTLTGLDPVTMFSDRPYRDARLITANALDVNWDAWFAGDPPNAVLTYARPGKAPASMVVELTDARYSPAKRTLSFTATREARNHDPMEKGANWERLTTPSAMRSVSLFIDSTTVTCPVLAPTPHLPRLLCGLV